MKRTVIFIFLLTISFTSFSQELTMNKTETVAFLAQQYKLTEGRPQMSRNEELIVKDCQLSFSRGMLTISYSVYDNNILYTKESLYFSPLDIISIDIAPESKTTEKPGSSREMIIEFNGNKSLSKFDTFDNPAKKYYNYRDRQSLYCSYDAGKGFDNFQKALLHLQKLLQAETDPFEQSASEKRLAVIFGKYKSCETSERPAGDYKGSNILVEDLLLSLHGPSASYSNVLTKTFLGSNLTSKDSRLARFWWYKINYIKYQVVAGALLIKATDKGTGVSIVYENVNLLTNKTFKGSGPDMIAFFKPAATDTNGEAKKDVLEIIELIKKIVKEYGGDEVKVEINEN